MIFQLEERDMNQFQGFTCLTLVRPYEVPPLRKFNISVIPIIPKTGRNCVLFNTCSFYTGSCYLYPPKIKLEKKRTLITIM